MSDDEGKRSPPALAPLEIPTPIGNPLSDPSPPPSPSPRRASLSAGDDDLAKKLPVAVDTRSHQLTRILGEAAPVTGSDGLPPSPVPPVELRAAIGKLGRIVAKLVVLYIALAVIVYFCRLNFVTRLMATALGWVVLQPGPYVYRGVWGSVRKDLAVLIGIQIVSISSGIIILTNVTPKDTPQSLPAIIFTPIQSTMFCLFIGFISIIWYYKGSTKKTPPDHKFDSNDLFSYMTTIGVFMVLIFEVGGRSVTYIYNTSGPNEFSIIYAPTRIAVYSLFLVICAILLFINRNNHDSYQYAHIVQYVMGISFTSSVCLTAMGLAIPGIDPRYFDFYLPLLFFGYKLLFVGIFFYMNAITWRMGPRHIELRFMFLFQFMESFFLDIFSFVSPNFDWQYILFVILRVIYMTSVQFGIFRRITDFIGLTSSTPSIATSSIAASAAQNYQVAPVPPSPGTGSVVDTPGAASHAGGFPSTPTGGGFGFPATPTAQRRRTPSVAAGSIREENEDSDVDEDLDDAVSAIVTGAVTNSPALLAPPLPTGRSHEGGARTPTAIDTPSPRSSVGNGGGDAVNKTSAASSKPPGWRAQAASLVNRVLPSAAPASATGAAAQRRRASIAAFEQVVVQRHASLGGAAGSLNPESVAAAALAAHDKAVRVPYGDTPTAHILFSAQTLLTNVLSVCTVIVLVGIDHSMPNGNCIMTCGVSLGTIYARIAIGIVAYAIIATVTLYMARRKLAAAGIHWHETLLTAVKHFQRSRWIIGSSVVFVLVGVLVAVDDVTLADIVRESNLKQIAIRAQAAAR